MKKNLKMNIDSSSFGGTNYEKLSLPSTSTHLNRVQSAVGLRTENPIGYINIVPDSAQSNLTKVNSVTSVTPRSRAKLQQSKYLNFMTNSNTRANIMDDQKSTTGSMTSQLFSNSQLAAGITQVQEGLSSINNLNGFQPSHKLHVTNECAEYQYDAMPQRELKISEEEYEEFRRKYHLMVFDGKGNYLYSKTEQKSMQEKQRLKGAFGKTKTTAKFRSEVHEKIKQFQPGKIVDNLVKSTQDLAKQHPRSKAIEEIKNKSMTSLVTLFNLESKQKIIEKSKQEIQNNYVQMNNEVEQLIRENQQLRAQQEKLLDQILELKKEAEGQNWKNSLIKRDMDVIKLDFDILQKNSVELEKFIPEYQIMVARFPDFKATKFLSDFQKLENKCVELANQISQLEMNNLATQDDQKKLKKDFEEQKLQLMRDEIERKQAVNLYMSQLREQENQISQVHDYQAKYMELFQRMLQTFTKWHSQLKVFTLEKKPDGGPRAELKDPIEMLQMMDEMISISSNDKLQNYLRKIIVSANLLQRNFFPDFVNEKFQPEQIYQRIFDRLQKNEAEIKRLTSENKNLKGSPHFEEIDQKKHDTSNEKEKYFADDK